MLWTYDIVIDIKLKFQVVYAITVIIEILN